MSFNIGDIVRVTDAAGVPGLDGLEAKIVHKGSDFFGSYYETELLEISPELQAEYDRVVPVFAQADQPIEVMNFDEAQLELVERATGVEAA